jgi:2-polyprenyl-6-methoxyphenol hydroxylase-like FAD-dependent oxidoreductase
MNQPAKATTVTIIGAGLGGIALVANLGLLGYRLRLHDRDEARIARVRERGGSTSKAWPRGSRRSSS